MSKAAERIRMAGCGAATSLDLLAIGLARREEDISEGVARDLLVAQGMVQRLGELSGEQLREVAGLEPFEAIRFLAVLELGRRVGGAGKGERTEITGAEDVAALFAHLRNEKKEHFCAAFLDSRNQVLKSTTIHIGTVNASLVGPREVFREAIREGAVSIVVAHNHPSGDPTPSPEDVAVTDRLVEVGRLLDIPVLDHVIIGDPKFVSFKERGLIQ